MQHIQISQEINDVFNTFVDACNTFAKKIIDVLTPIFKKIDWLCQRLWAVAYDCYSSAGMPYGENNDGLLQWWEEMCLLAITRDSLEREVSWLAARNSIHNTHTRKSTTQG